MNTKEDLASYITCIKNFDRGALQLPSQCHVGFNHLWTVKRYFRFTVHQLSQHMLHYSWSWMSALTSNSSKQIDGGGTDKQKERRTDGGKEGQIQVQQY